VSLSRRQRKFAEAYQYITGFELLGVEDVGKGKSFATVLREQAFWFQLECESSMRAADQLVIDYELQRKEPGK